jgi:DNA-binding Xre family transcriptional regulator
MIKVNIKEIAEKNKCYTAYKLQKTLGIQPSLAAKWYRNDLKMIGIESLNTLCAAFKCLPSDILIYVADEDVAQISNTESSKAQSSNAESSNVESSNTKLNNSKSSIPDYSNIPDLPALDDESDMWLSTKDVGEFTNRDERTARDFYKQGLTRTKTKNKGSFVKLSDLTLFWKSRDK